MVCIKGLGQGTGFSRQKEALCSWNAPTGIKGGNKWQGPASAADGV